MSLYLVRAAAGCGKTTDLAKRYLRFLADGIPVEKAVAITFTRRAAAELQERVTLALRACLDGPAAERARARLGPSWDLYSPVAPRDPTVVRDALAGLSDAPIGTTDAFIGMLLTEFALDASLPIPGREVGVPLDIPVRAGGGFKRILDGVARRVLDPPVLDSTSGGLDPDVKLLTRYYKLDDVLKGIGWRTPLDHLPVAGCAEVMTWVSHHIARELDTFDLEAFYQVRGASADHWEEALEKKTNLAGKWAVRPVAEWLAAGGEIDGAPHQIAGWMRGLKNQGPLKKIKAALEKSEIDFGIATLTLAKVIESLRYPYEDPQHVALADSLRAARERLRERVVQDGMTAAAAAGSLGHDELAEAAIALCQSPPAGMVDRFRALLVDEVQDANPAQIRLYRALADLPGSKPIETYFVGDSRQSIYLFRGAEPAAFHDLADRAGDSQTLDLVTNFRSTPTLVGAHRQLFGALKGPMERAGLLPLADLSTLAHHLPNAEFELHPAYHQDVRAVWLVKGGPTEKLKDRQVNDRALHAFLGRVQDAWKNPKHFRDTAAVLAPTWFAARKASAMLRRWAGRDDIAYVEGGGGWTAHRVGTDLVFWLRALLDSTDDVAWLALWKHPAIGLSDAAIARARQGTGVFKENAETGEFEPAPGWTNQLGHLVDADGLAPPHSDADISAFAHAMPLIRQARSDMGRRETAEIVDILAADLNWRTVLAAGPGGDDDVAELEVLLDWVRSMSAEGLPDDDIVNLIGDSEFHDPPQVHLNRPSNYITCTTVFQAKGLAWDHVAVMSPGRGSRRDPTDDASTTWVTLGDERQVRLVGLKFDPTGGLSPFKDPLGRLGSAILRERFNEECARLAYVAVTRARRSVTLGIPNDLYGAGDVQKLIAQAWSRADFTGGITRIERAQPPDAALAPTGWARVRPGASLQPDAAFGQVWHERQPSSTAAHLTPEERKQRAEQVANLVRLANGLHVGGDSIDPPEEDFEQLLARDWGQIAHGWFAEWRFAGAPEPSRVAAWLRGEWGAAPPRVASWLLTVSQSMIDREGPMWALVTDPSAKLHFEYPLVGVGRGRDQALLLSGRIDLLVERKRTLTVVDFKAGANSPTGWEDLEDQASLKTYGPQLDAYRDTLANMGREVDMVALWFVRTGASVRW